MDEYYNKYARPLGKLSLYEVKQSLSLWRDNLREELEGLIYMRNGLNNDNLNKIEQKVKTKLLDIINKLENISLKEIECISEFMYEIEKSGVIEVDEKIFTKLEFIRENYNKILLNIQKMVSSSNVLLEMREKYERNKMSLVEIKSAGKKGFNTNTNNNQNRDVNLYSNSKETPQEQTNNNLNKEWLDKLTNDVENLNKEQNLYQKKKSSPGTNTQYTVDKEMETINNNKASIKKSKTTERKGKSTHQRIKSAKEERKLYATTPERIGHANTNNINANLPQPKANYDAIRNLTEEISHIKEYCKELRKNQEENCIMENEKKNFDKMKNEHIKLNADVNIIKEDIKEILGNYQILMKRVESLEEENKALRQHNKNLVKFISGITNNNYGKQNYLPYIHEEDNYNPNIANIGNTNNLRNINVEYSTPLSELSAFNTVHNQSSMEMNTNINNNLEIDKKRRRFLIPKTNY